MKSKLIMRVSSLALVPFTIASSLFFLVSCAQRQSPYSLMLEFCKNYGIDSVVFSPEISEGEAGYTDEDFFKTVFDEGIESVEDYAIVFLSSLDYVGECSVFLCYSEYDALRVCDMLRRRIDLLKSVGAGINTSYVSESVIFKSGKYVVMCSLADNELAERIWKKLL